MKVNLDVKHIRHLLSRRGWDTSSLAYRMGVSPDLVRGVMNKGVCVMHTATKMADALNVPIIEITTA